MWKSLACMLLAATGALGADFTGLWTGHAADRNGDLQDFSFRFEQQDAVLTGKMYGDNESVPITEGKVSGDSISFLVTTELNGSVTKILFSGILKDGEIQTTRGRVDSKSEKPAAKPEKPAPKQTFVLKRL